MSEELKPCPFCGGQPHFNFKTDSWTVSDSDMGGFGGGQSTMHRSWLEIGCQCGISKALVKANISCEVEKKLNEEFPDYGKNGFNSRDFDERKRRRDAIWTDIERQKLVSSWNTRVEKAKFSEIKFLEEI